MNKKSIIEADLEKNTLDTWNYHVTGPCSRGACGTDGRVYLSSHFCSQSSFKLIKEYVEENVVNLAVFIPEYLRRFGIKNEDNILRHVTEIVPSIVLRDGVILSYTAIKTNKPLGKKDKLQLLGFIRHEYESGWRFKIGCYPYDTLVYVVLEPSWDNINDTFINKERLINISKYVEFSKMYYKDKVSAPDYEFEND